MLSSTGLQATPSNDSLREGKSTKEVIIINYDDISSADLNSIVAYAQSTYDHIPNAKVTIKDYTSDANLANTKMLLTLVNDLKEAGIASDKISVSKEENIDAPAYFSITIAAASEVQ